MIEVGTEVASKGNPRNRHRRNHRPLCRDDPRDPATRHPHEHLTEYGRPPVRLLGPRRSQLSGSVTPLLLLHNFVGDGVSTCGNQLETLSDEFTVVASHRRRPVAGGHTRDTSGLTTTIGLQEGLERTVAWYRKHVGVRTARV